MIPKFPEFKKLELADRKEIEAITSKFEPYSDFDFDSMWAWDVNEEIRLSTINGNLIAILADHFTGQYFYSFIGDNEINKTLKQIFAFSEITENKLPILRAVPEVSLNNIDLKKFLIEIDLNNCDYVYSSEQLSGYEGPSFSQKRKLFNRFSRANPEANMRVLDTGNDNVQKMILEFSKMWMKNKSKEDAELNLSKELLAIERFLKADFKDSYSVGLFVGEKLVGYQLCTIVPKDYAICHFGKIDVSYHGAFEYMMSKSSAMLLEKGVHFINTEEDLGLIQLRYTKNSYRPIKILRKYTIREL